MIDQFVLQVSKHVLLSLQAEETDKKEIQKLKTNLMDVDGTQNSNVAFLTDLQQFIQQSKVLNELPGYPHQRLHGAMSCSDSRILILEHLHLHF